VQWFTWWCISACGGGSPPLSAKHLNAGSEQVAEIAKETTNIRKGMSLALSNAQNAMRTITFTTLPKEDVMAEFTSGFFMGDKATNGRILVVDDEADIRKVVRMTLQKAGYDVLEAENGEKAIETINSGENRLLLDVLICDIRMPKINGVEAIAYFRANYPRVPVIVLTGFPDADMATSMLRQGVVDYLVKPVEGEKLRESVARAMEQRELAHL
jgi:two-component system chemotaxis response regulator CheY